MLSKILLLNLLFHNKFLKEREGGEERERERREEREGHKI